MFSDTPLKVRIVEAKRQANLRTALAADPGLDFLAGLVGDDDSTALHLTDAAQGLCANVTPREKDVWSPKRRPVRGANGLPITRNGRKVWAHYLLKPKRTSRKERALLEGDLHRFVALDDLDAALNAGEITNEQHAHRLAELSNERLTGNTTDHSRHVDVFHETADDEPVLMMDKRAGTMLDAERAQREEVRWLNGFYITQLADVEGWGDTPLIDQFKLSRNPDQLTFENTIPKQRIKPLLITLLRRERVREADIGGHRPFRTPPPQVKVNGLVNDTKRVQARLDAELHAEREQRVEAWLTSIGRMRHGKRFVQPRDPEGFRMTVPAGPGVACSTARLTPGQSAPVLAVDALLACERNVALVLAVWRYEGV